MRLACAALLVPAAMMVGTGPAHADARPTGVCQPGHGVTVTVEPGSLGGPDRSVCEPNGGGRSAAELFAAAGFPLTRVNSQEAFVCRVAGAPADASCAQVPPANAYWSLWWSDGHSRWVYSALAVDGLTVPAGGAVAFTWVDGSDDGRPATPPPGVAAAGASAAPTATSRTASSARTGDSASGGLPGWVPPVALVALIGVGGGTALARRRR